MAERFAADTENKMRSFSRPTRSALAVMTGERTALLGISLAVAFLVALVVASGGLSRVSAQAARHGGPYVGPGGSVGPLRIDSSTVDDVVAFAGQPDADQVDSFQVPNYPDFEALGYRCQRHSGAGTAPVTYYHGPYCHSVFYINENTNRLAAVFTSSARYVGPGQMHPGSSAGKAERRTHTQAIAGCFHGFFLGSHRRPATMLVTIVGGRVVSNPGRASTIIGGRVSSFSLESNAHPVGLLFC